MRVGGLLDLNQVLRKTWLGLDHLLDFDTRVKDGAPWKAEIADLTCFVGYMDPTRGS
jgi:hypothetical protein